MYAKDKCKTSVITICIVLMLLSLENVHGHTLLDTTKFSNKLLQMSLDEKLNTIKGELPFEQFKLNTCVVDTGYLY